MRFVDFDSLGKSNQFVKPAVGEAVNYEGRKYVVTEVGLKYLHVKDPTTGTPGLVKVTEISKWIDPADAQQKPNKLDNLSEFAEFEN